MSVIYKDDLVDANGSTLISKLESSSENAKRISTLIYSFNSTSKSYLKGSGYDAVRKKMELYIDAFDKYSKICEHLISAIKASNNTMINYMEDYDSLDNSFIVEIETNLNDAKRTLGILESYTTVEKTEGTEESTDDNKVRIGSDKEIATCRQNIRELEKELELLKNLDSTVSTAWKNMNLVEGDINLYSNAITSINPTIF